MMNTPQHRVSVSPAAVLDEATWTMYGSLGVLEIVASLRAQYKTGPEAPWPTDQIIWEIYSHWCKFLEEFFDDAELRALPGGAS